MAAKILQSGRKLIWDTAELDKDFQMDETSEYLYVSPVTIAREGVFPYEDGRALKPGGELRKAAQSSRLYISWNHPPAKVVTQRKEIIGSVDSVHSQDDGKGVKVKGRLVFYKKQMNQDQQNLIRSGARRDVSVGFYYVEDRTPGSWNGQTYDYIQREILFDHVASVDHGRCSYPSCGIGVDQDPTPIRVAVDPTPHHEDLLPMQKMKDEYLSSYLQPTEAHLRIATVEGQNCGNCIYFHQQDNACQLIEGQVSANMVCDLFTPRTTLRDMVQQMRAGSSADWDEELGFIEGDRTLTYKARQSLSKSQFAYVDPKTGKGKLPIHDRRHVIAALNAVQNWSFRGQTLSIPRSAKSRIKGKVCAAARRFGVKSAFCGTADSAEELVRNLMAMDREDLVGFHRFVHRADDFVEDGPIHHAVLYVLRKKAS